MDGVPIPAKICIVGQEEKKVYVYDTNDYMDIIEDMDTYVSMSPTKGIDGFVEKNSPRIISFDISNVADSSELYDFIRGTKGQVKVHITDRNVWGWSKYYYNNNEHTFHYLDHQTAALVQQYYTFPHALFTALT